MRFWGVSFALFVVISLPGESAGQSEPYLAEWFTRPALLVEKPTSYYRPDSFEMTQTTKAGNLVPLQSSKPVRANKALYYPATTGELIMAQSPPGGGTAEQKGRLVYLPKQGEGLPVRVGNKRVYLREKPVLLKQYRTTLLSAGSEVQARYVTPDRRFVFVEHNDRAGWVFFRSLDWPISGEKNKASVVRVSDQGQVTGGDSLGGKRSPTAVGQRLAEESPPSNQPSPGDRSLRGVIQKILNQYNEAVQRSVDYYQVTVGRTVAARTFKLGAVRKQEGKISITLDLEQGEKKLAAEKLLQSLLAQELGREVQIIWP